MSDGATMMRSPVRQKTMNVTSTLFHKAVPTSRSKHYNTDEHMIHHYQKAPSKRSVLTKNTQPKMAESSSKGRIVK